ncbi:MAG: TerC family protein [Desulfobacteraceae bacterium]|nr:MAG: TerC family protein [Desulfobacteraceae bacterium]
MDFSQVFNITLDWKFFTALLSIVLIDLVLAGDNAVVIAMAVRMLPKHQRRKGIAFGAGAAVLLRVVLTFFVAQLLRIPLLKFFGGAVILWIAIKLLVQGGGEESTDKGASSIWDAIKLIVIADLTMSTDNVLAVAGASHGNLFLLLFGLTLSIPFVVFTSNLLAWLMDKYPIVLWIGAAVLGRVGGEMIITDPMVEKLLHPNKIAEWGVQIFFTAAVLIVGWLLIKRRTSRLAENHQGAEK